MPASKDVGWVAQSYNVSPADAQGTYGKAAMLGNVIANPLPNRQTWGGDGIHGGDPGLQIWSRSQSIKDADGDELLPSGEIVSSRKDMKYGSFRVAMKMSDVPGTCAAFFWVSRNHARFRSEGDKKAKIC